jgi:hypothetical protein
VWEIRLHAREIEGRREKVGVMVTDVEKELKRR